LWNLFSSRKRLKLSFDEKPAGWNWTPWPLATMHELNALCRPGLCESVPTGAHTKMDGNPSVLILPVAFKFSSANPPKIAVPGLPDDTTLSGQI
jgi:hypothetical protein